jgi:hypothetical protein
METELPQNIPNDHMTYQHLPLQDPPKFTQIGTFGFKIYHLATLHVLISRCRTENALFPDLANVAEACLSNTHFVIGNPSLVFT